MTQAMPPMSAPEPRRKLSISSLMSFIFGLLGCVPFVTGGLAILLGIVGLVRTSNPMKWGRWMAIVGLLLGIVSVSGWGLFGAGIFALIKGTEPPRTATHDFIQALSAGDLAKAKSLSSGVSDMELQGLIDGMKEDMGAFEDTTFNQTNISGSRGTVEGVAQFRARAGGSPKTLHVEAALTSAPDGWKVTDIKFRE